MNFKNSHITKLVLFYLFLMLSACAGQDRKFGEDVRAMQRAQIYDNSAGFESESKPVPQDGQKAQIVIDTFWEVGMQRKQIHNAIDINVGN